MDKNKENYPFYSAQEEIDKVTPGSTQEDGPQRYPLAFLDWKLLLREELRAVRLQLELLKPELVLKEHDIRRAVAIFGSARIPDPEHAQHNLAMAKAALAESPNDAKLQRQMRQAERIVENSRYLLQATRFAEIVSQDESLNLVIFTGGGPSFMQAANKGAINVKARSVALNVFLPNEQAPNPYVTPELTFQFHYFAIRKMHFLMRAKALAAFPGGFGTLDEVFEAITLMQTKKIDKIPLLLFHKEFWTRIINFEALVDEGTISEEDLALFHYVETAEEAWQYITEFYQEN